MTRGMVWVGGSENRKINHKCEDTSRHVAPWPHPSDFFDFTPKLTTFNGFDRNDSFALSLTLKIIQNTYKQDKSYISTRLV